MVFYVSNVFYLFQKSLWYILYTDKLVRHEIEIMSGLIYT